MIDMT